MMNYQQNNYGYGMPYNNGVQYNGQPQKVNQCSTLTAEEINQLRSNGDKFSLNLTRDEALRGICYHVNADGSPAYIDNPDGSITCTICHKTWRSDPLDQQQVQESVNNIISVLQTIKLMYKNMPETAAREYFQIIPLIEKIPQLYKIADDNFRTYENAYNGYMGGINPFAIFSQVQNGGIGGFMNQPYGNPGATGYYQQGPVPGYQGQPMYQNPQPQGAPGYVPPTPMGGNPLYGNMQTNGYTGPQPQAAPQGYAYAPGQVAPNPTVDQPQTAPTQPEKVESNGNHTA